MPFAPGHEGWVLLNPGPACTSPRVRAAQLRGDLCHREEEFGHLLLGLHAKLRTALDLPSTYGAVTLAGSGTAIVEAAVTSLVRPGRALAVVANGVYGERVAQMARAHEIPLVEVRVHWTEALPLDAVAAALAEHPEVDAVVAVHHETTTGRLNSAAEIGALAHGAGALFVLDAISSLGCDDLDVEAMGVDALLGSSNKGFHGTPGLSFALLSPLALERMEMVTPRSVYLHLGRYLKPQEHGDVPFTPAIQTCYALDEALDELAERGGMTARVEEYGQRARLVREGMAHLGVEQLLPHDAPLSNALTAFRLPQGFTYEALHDALKEHGYIIYAGQGHLGSDVFRVANMGELSLATLRAFLTVFEEALRSRPVQVPTSIA